MSKKARSPMGGGQAPTTIRKSDLRNKGNETPSPCWPRRPAGHVTFLVTSHTRNKHFMKLVGHNFTNGTYDIPDGRLLHVEGHVKGTSREPDIQK